MNASPDVGRMRETFSVRQRATADSGGGSGFELPGGLTKRQALIGLVVLGVGAAALSGGRRRGRNSDFVRIYQ